MNTYPMDYAAIEAQPGLAGNVYFLAPVNFENAAFCKIGRAKNDPEARCAQINKSSTGDVLWGVRHVVTVDDHIRFERLVHQLLASWRNQGADSGGRFSTCRLTTPSLAPARCWRS